MPKELSTKLNITFEEPTDEEVDVEKVINDFDEKECKDFDVMTRALIKDFYNQLFEDGCSIIDDSVLTVSSLGYPETDEVEIFHRIVMSLVSVLKEYKRKKNKC